ncbi:uncharacterized protein [Rutidosis leptorrhynchoides]|uniref:uncharacterized protein n=1 Tax=Rutidosis leptorrhynchoides TaxID=125765 RepID=UPI003A99031C
MLKIDARIWFDSLSRDSVSSFNELKRQFKSKFSQQKRHKKNHVAAHSIRQKDSEGTKVFLGRYTDETQQITGLPETQRISGLFYGCKARALVEHLTLDLPDSYEVLIDEAYVWLDAKETTGTFAYDDQPSVKRRDRVSHREEKHRRRDEKGIYAPYRRESHARILGTLIKTPDIASCVFHISTLKEILSTENAAQGIKPPPKLSNKGKQKDTSKFCDFHNDYGHETDECIQLRIAIEEAVRSGKLSQLVKGIRNSKTPKVTEQVIEDKNPNMGKTILTVNNCFAVESQRCYKRERPSQVIEWEEISFPALDTITPSDLPVTISGLIFNREVHRVYLDSGSSCDIMYEHCFEQLSPGIRARLRPPRVPLMGFSDKRCWPIGEIDLDFTIGTPSMTRTGTLDFIVVRSTSQHNILPGRFAMMKMGIIVSRVHQLFKFHTVTGITTLTSTYDRSKVVMAIRDTIESTGECIREANEELSQQ